jgi:hypothetical protein
MRGLNTNGQYFLQFPQNNIGDHFPPNTPQRWSVSSPLMLHWRAKILEFFAQRTTLAFRSDLSRTRSCICDTAILDLRPDGYAKSVNDWQSLRSSLGPWTPRRKKRKMLKKEPVCTCFGILQLPAGEGWIHDPVQIHGRGSRFDLQCGSP